MPSALVVGAGTFGASLAELLARSDWDVTLVDVFEPGDPRSESGGETRLLRFSHGGDELYTRLAWRARELWRELGSGVLIEAGLVWFARREGGWESESEGVMRAAGVPVERLDPEEAARLFPSLHTDDLVFAVHETEAGLLRAGDGVRALTARGREAGMRVLRGQAAPAGERVELAGETLEADHVIWACGAWMAPLFPELLDVRVTRQDVVLFDAPEEWTSPGVPGWVDFDTSFYGHGLIEPYGLKASCDAEGGALDPDARPEQADPASVERSRRYIAERFPALAGARVRSSPVCHYSLSPDGGFLFGRHPEHERVWLLGGGSGHGFKHGPAVAEHVAAVLRDEAEPEPRFALAGRGPGGALRTAGS